MTMCAFKLLCIPAFFIAVLLITSSAAVSCVLADSGSNQKGRHFQKVGHSHSSPQGSEGVSGHSEDISGVSVDMSDVSKDTPGVSEDATGPSENSPGVEVTGPELRRVSYMSAATGGERDYFVYLPKGYGLAGDSGESGESAESRWPVMLFLHGNGERGDAREELDYVMIHGPLYEAWVRRRDLPFVVVTPQLPMYGMDERHDYIANRTPDMIPRRLEEGVPPRRPASVPAFPMDGTPSVDPAADPTAMPYPPEGPPDGWYRLEQDLMDILDQVEEQFLVDADRVYLTGISYGGFGTWHIAARHPARFAAIAPVVGYGHPDGVEPIARHGLPVWCFAGGRDAVVPPQYFYPAMNRLQELGHTGILFTNHEDMGHDAWVRIYAGQDLYDWFLEHRRPDRAGR